jgi:hypothetical protein
MCYKKLLLLHTTANTKNISILGAHASPGDDDGMRWAYNPSSATAQEYSPR